MENVKIADTTANPAPLGLFGFGLTTILLNIHNAGIIPIDTMIIAMGVFYGGIAQIIAGILESKKNNTFGTLVFISFGSFWLIMAFIWIMPYFGLPKAGSDSMAWFLVVWGIFAVALFICTLKGNTIGKIIFGTVCILFFLLAWHSFTGDELIGKIAGYEGILCGCLACYEGAAIVINQKYEKTVFPL